MIGLMIRRIHCRLLDELVLNFTQLAWSLFLLHCYSSAELSSACHHLPTDNNDDDDNVVVVVVVVSVVTVSVVLSELSLVVAVIHDEWFHCCLL